MKIDNGRRGRLVIDGVFDGVAGVARQFVSFIPNRSARSPEEATAGTLDGEPVLLSPAKDPNSSFWVSRFERVQ